MIRRAVAAFGGVALLVGCSAILGLGDGTIREAGDAALDGAVLPSDAGGAGGDATTELESGAPDGGPAVADVGASTPCDGAPGTCPSFTPSGGIAAADLSGAGLVDFVLEVHDAGTFGDETDGGDAGPSPGDTLIDVDTGEITAGGVVLRPASTGNLSIRDVQAGIAYRQTDQNIAVFTFLSLAVPAGTTLELVGQHAVALLSSTDITVDGVIEARPMNPDGSNICGPDPANAPGGFAGGAGETKGHQGAYTPPSPGGGMGGGGGGASAPGGGGGHATPGGAGCEPSDASLGTCGTGGGTYDTAALDVNFFHGGSGGGGGGVVTTPYSTGPSGGNGGGALRVVAANSLTVAGRIDASGCGGGAGAGCTSCGDAPAEIAGGGGGAGGAIVLESPRVSLQGTAAVYAVGGAGGWAGQAGGSSENNAGCEESNVGSPHPGAGAGQAPNYDADGGAQAGLGPTGCGGGGGFGWIRINAGGEAAAIAQTAVVNPGPGSGAMTTGPLSP